MVFTNRNSSPMTKPVRRALATDKVRFVGDPVAVVIAESVHKAREAAEAVMLDIDVLPAVTQDWRTAIRPGAPQLYEGLPAIAFSITSLATVRR